MAFTFTASANILRWPAALLPNQMTVHLQAHTTRFEAPFTRSTQTQELPGARFTVSAGFPPLIADKTRLARAFGAKLRGSAGRFYFPVEVTDEPVAAGGLPESAHYTPLTADNTTGPRADSSDYTCDADTYISSAVATVTAGGDNVTIVAATNLEVGTVMIQAGRHLSYDTPDGWRRLHLVVDDAVVLLGKLVRITVEPPMRVRPAVGTPLHLRSPSGVFMLADDDQLQLSLTPGVFGQATLEAVEAYPSRVLA